MFSVRCRFRYLSHMLRYDRFQWMKLDELFDKERNIRRAMTNRAGVLSLMLHQTIDHDSLKPILKTAN